jgi:hypothetical protein
MRHDSGLLDHGIDGDRHCAPSSIGGHAAIVMFYSTDDQGDCNGKI